MRYTLIGIITIAMAAATPAFAQSRAPLPGEVIVEIVSDSGSIFRAIPHQTFRTNGTQVVKNYLEARKGENYGIVIRNNTPERIGAVIAVDGRNIISGKKSELKNSEIMYIVNGYDSARYDGWRTSRDQVHKFYFTEPTDSYSVKTFADSSAMGVIAVAITVRKSGRGRCTRGTRASLRPPRRRREAPRGARGKCSRTRARARASAMRSTPPW